MQTQQQYRKSILLTHHWTKGNECTLTNKLVLHTAIGVIFCNRQICVEKTVTVNTMWKVLNEMGWQNCGLRLEKAYQGASDSTFRRSYNAKVSTLTPKAYIQEYNKKIVHLYFPKSFKIKRSQQFVKQIISKSTPGISRLLCVILNYILVQNCCKVTVRTCNIY